MTDKSTSGGSSGRRVDRLTGKTIAGRYVIERLIARGGMAAVYQAHQVQLNRKVAIKILRPPPDTDESANFHERFRLEAETLAQLNHPNIVTVYDHGVFDDDQVFLTMEYVEGLRLTDVLRDGAVPVERILPLLMQVCEALRYAHRRGVVHRDLKPSNLLITKTDDDEELVKVVDFGLVKLTEVDMSVTSAGLILGSPHCMAPEQVRGLAVDPRTDVYALGVLLFRSLTGKYPFHGANSTATMIAHLNEPTPTFFSVAPDLEVPEGLENIVRRCLAKKPAERYASMEELQEALSFYLGMSPEQFRAVARSQSTLGGLRLPQDSAKNSGNTMLIVGGLGALAVISLALCLGVLGVVGLPIFSGNESGTSASEAAIEPVDEVPAQEPEEIDPPSDEGEADPPSDEASPEPASRPVTAPEPDPRPRPATPPKTKARPVDSPAETEPARADPEPKEAEDPSPEPEEKRDPESEKPDLGKDFVDDFDDW